MCVALAEKRYLTDVGVNSESPRVPLEITEGLIQSDGISNTNLPAVNFGVGCFGRRNAAKSGSASLASLKSLR